MSPKKSGLGKGLDALIPSVGFSGGEQPPSQGILQLPVDEIQPNPRQPRGHFDPQALGELAASIREHGVLQPLIVTRPAADARYTLIAGERRLLAARQAGLTTVPVLVREATDQQRIELALIENVQRADLSPLETAEAYRQLTDDFELSHEAIAARVGKSRAAVSNTLRLLKLPPVVQQALTADQITEGHARALLALPTPQAQTTALQTILKHEMNVRQTEDLVHRMSGEKLQPDALRSSHAKPTAAPEIAALEERLRTRLGTKVHLNPRRKGGTLVIQYYSDEELDTLTRLILGPDPM